MTDKIVKKTGGILPIEKIVANEIPVAKKENDFGAEIATLIHKAGTIKLTEKQKGILYAKVEEEDVEIRPDGLVYLPWMEYETRLREAFGLEYALIPQGLPKLENNLVLWGHWLIIRGCPMGFSFGQQEYFPSNKTMNWGDAVEGAKSNALMRLCKGLGITLELWKPSWVKAWKDKYALSYWALNKRTGKQQLYWKKAEKKPVFVKDERKIVDFETQKGESYVATVDVPKDEKKDSIPISKNGDAIMQKDIIPPDDEVQMGEIIQKEMNKMDTEAEKNYKINKLVSAINFPTVEKPQNAPESTQKEKLTPTTEKETKKPEPPTEEEIQGKVIDLAQEVTGEEIPYICSVKDGLSESQFYKIKEIHKSHYLSDEEHDVLKRYLLNGQMTKKDATECIDYLLTRLKFYGEFERELVKDGVVKDIEMASTILSYVIRDFSDTKKVRKNKAKYIEAIKEAVEGENE